MSLREATLADLDDLLALELACYPPAQAYSRAEYRYALGPARAVNLAWEDVDGIVGFVGAFHHRGRRTGNVYTVNVHPTRRGRGLGAALLSACEDRLRSLGVRRVVLEVNVENAPAIRLYEGLGYTRLRRLPGYYRTYAHPDAFRYGKDLS